MGMGTSNLNSLNLSRSATTQFYQIFNCWKNVVTDKKCYECNKQSTNLKRCKNCDKLFCSKVCQKRDWKKNNLHRKRCVKTFVCASG